MPAQTQTRWAGMVFPLPGHAAAWAPPLPPHASAGLPPAASSSHPSHRHAPGSPRERAPAMNLPASATPATGNEAVDADALVRQVQAGDREAFRTLFLAFERPVRCYLSAHASSAEMVDEVLQATFVACFESIRTYEPRGTFSSWLRGIARNRLLKELRQRARHDHVGGDVLEATLAAAAAAQVAAASDEHEPELQRCLDQVTPRVRALLQRRYVDRIAVKQLALELGQSETWVSVTLHRTKAILRDCLQRGVAAIAASAPTPRRAPAAVRP
jgi:RNA polymerase sigma-70 factor (ECF subfamily)